MAPFRVLVYGESQFDAQALKELIVALCPSLDGHVEWRRAPITLARGIDPGNIPARAARLAEFIRREKAKDDLGCVFVHEDCDALEPAHELLARRIEDSMRNHGVDVHAVTPAWEIEAWWMLWPDTVGDLRAAWLTPRRLAGRRVGMIENAKEELKAALTDRRLSSKKRVPYRETDSPEIASLVRERGVANAPQGRSDSYDSFRARVANCCSAHDAK